MAFSADNRTLVVGTMSGTVRLQMIPAARQIGQSLPVSGTSLDLALSAPAVAVRRAAGGVLSEREREIMALLAAGATDAQIAVRLFLSVNTVRSHLERIRDKTGARRRPELVRYAIAAGIEPVAPVS